MISSTVHTHPKLKLYTFIMGFTMYNIIIIINNNNNNNKDFY